MIAGGDGQKTSGLTQVLLNNKLMTYLMDAMIGQLKEQLKENPELDKTVVLKALILQFELHKSAAGKSWTPTSLSNVFRGALARDSVNTSSFPFILPIFNTLLQCESILRRRLLHMVHTRLLRNS